MNTFGSWQYFEVSCSRMVGLWKKQLPVIHSIFISWWAMYLVGKPNTKSADRESFPFMSPIHVCTSVFKFTWSQTPGWSGVYRWGFLQTGQIRTRQQQMEDVNKKCGNILHKSYSTESACSRRGVNAEQWTVSKPDATWQHNRSSLSTGHLNFVSVHHK